MNNLGANWEPSRNCTIPAAWRRVVDAFPEQEALVYPQRGLRWTYRDLDQQSLDLARAFVTAGIGKGDHVTVWAENVPEWVVLQLALARVGAVLVTANTALKTPEIEYLLRQSDSVAVCSTTGPEGRYLESLAAIRNDLSELRHQIFLGEQAPSPVVSYQDFLQGAAKTDADTILRLEQDQNPDEVINMQYTSGTTGSPKGVMLTHRNLVNNAHGLGTKLDYQAGERLALTVPLFHCFGCVVSSLGAFVNALTLCGIDQFEPEQTLDLLEGERCNIVYGVPTHFRLMVEAQERNPRNLTTLRTGIMGGAPCPRELVERIVTDLHVPHMTAAYGLTECSPGVSINRPDDDLDRRASTVGFALDDIEVRVIDPATNEELPRGERGELHVRGHCVMKGYYKEPEQTAKVLLPDGWLRTGDLATMAEDGTLRIVGRLKEMIIRGGENVSPAEVEDALRKHPQVRDAAVFGIPHEVFGEEVRAAVLMIEGADAREEELRQFLAPLLAGAKIPSRIHPVAAFPMTASGKVQKFRLAEQFQGP